MHILNRFYADGVELVWDGRTLLAGPPERVTDEHRALIRENRLTIIQGLKLGAEIRAEGEHLGMVHYLSRLSCGFGADPDLPVHRRCIEAGYLDERGRFTEQGFDFHWNNRHRHPGATIH